MWVFTNFHNPHKEYGSNRLFHNDLKEVLEKDAAHTAAPSLQGLLTVTQLVMNSWEKDAFRSQQRAELGADTKRKGQIASTTQGGKCSPWIGSKAYKAADVTNIANGNGAKHPMLIRPHTKAVSQPRDFSKQNSKYGPTGKNTKFKKTRFTDQYMEDHRDNRYRGNTLPAYSLLHITCDCDDTDVDTMYRTCCITTGNIPHSLSVTTLFDTGANPSSHNRVSERTASASTPRL